MLKSLLEWNRKRRDWNRRHGVAWAGQDLPGVSGITPFQEHCEAGLKAVLQARGLELRNRSVVGKSELFIKAEFGTMPWTIWIYPSQAELRSPHGSVVNLEAWDALTPDELIHRFLGHVETLLQDVPVRESV